MNKRYFRLIQGIIILGCLAPVSIQAQITPDSTTNTTVDVSGNDFTIQQGDRAGGNLFHSFGEFSVPTDGSAFFNNAADIVNIFSRVTGGNISSIDGLLRANGSASLFLLNPAGIMFGPNARLNIGGSFIGTSADSIEFLGGVEFSASDTQASPTLTINAPIGLNFRDNPGEITNSAFDAETFTGLEVPADKTLALIGGDISIESGFLSTNGGRIELGSVIGNNTVSLTEVEKGWDIGYKGVENFQDINLSGLSVALSGSSFGAINTGDIELQGRNISLTEGSSIVSFTTGGKVGNISVVASESLELSGRSDFGRATTILNNIFGDATGEGSSINIDTPQLTVSDGALIQSSAAGTGQGVDININSSEIIVEGSFDDTLGTNSLITAQVAGTPDAIGDAGDIKITTETLTVNEGAQITVETFGAGNAGDLTVTATESIELSGTIPGSTDPSALTASVGQSVNATGNGGNLTINTPRLVVRDGAQISNIARNKGDAGNLTINVDESILLTGTSPEAEFRGEGLSGIFVNVQQAFIDSDTGVIPTTGKGGNLNISAEDLTVEKGAAVNASTFSLGDGGNANINVDKLIVREGGEISAGSVFLREGGERVTLGGSDRGTGGTLIITAESIEVTGVGDINGQQVKSSLFTLAESNGDAGNLTINTEELTVSDRAEIDTSTTGQGNAGNLNITTDNLTVISDGGQIDARTEGQGNAGNLTIKSGELIISDGGQINASTSATTREGGSAGNIFIAADELNLDNGSITASTNAGEEGNISLVIDDDISLRDDSLISARAANNADGGNITINTQYIFARPNTNNDIVANAIGGRGGNINITANRLFAIEERSSTPPNRTNDIDASSEFGLDGTVIIDTSDTQLFRQALELQGTVAVNVLGIDACSRAQAKEESTFIVTGRGGIPRQPTEPLMADALIPDGKPISIDKEAALNSLFVEQPEKKQENPHYIPVDIKPIKTSRGDIYPARGFIKTEDGRVILTTYPTDNINNRTPDNSANCNPS
ncbi:MAG: filamentous hemagglutinin N-terminal domain-containing protein [Xenococcus sp. MO_188.B8]|nr:filamentous hemagglutinin N-terminal domain-containing protein [Xenococcus sp. MO_188.B8]